LVLEALHGLKQPVFRYRFEEIINRLLFKRFYGILIEGRYKDDPAETCDSFGHLHPGKTGHADIQEGDLRPL